jgi:hypothetical protein
MGPIGGNGSQIWVPLLTADGKDKTGAIARLAAPGGEYGSPPERSERSSPARRHAATIDATADCEYIAPQGRSADPWTGDAIRRAASAIRETYSTDSFIMARRALEAAVRNEADLIELLPPNTVAISALPRRTDVVSATAHVG